MNKQTVIKRLLDAASAKKWNMGSAFGGAAPTAGSINVLPGDMNKAIADWLERGDSRGVQKVTDTLHIVGGLNDSDYEQIMKAIDGEK